MQVCDARQRAFASFDIANCLVHIDRIIKHNHILAIENAEFNKECGGLRRIQKQEECIVVTS